MKRKSTIVIVVLYFICVEVFMFALLGANGLMSFLIGGLIGTLATACHGRCGKKDD